MTTNHPWKRGFPHLKALLQKHQSWRGNLVCSMCPFREAWCSAKGWRRSIEEHGSFDENWDILLWLWDQQEYWKRQDRVVCISHIYCSINIDTADESASAVLHCVTGAKGMRREAMKIKILDGLELHISINFIYIGWSKSTRPAQFILKRSSLYSW